MFEFGSVFLTISVVADEKNARLKQELEELQYELAKEDIEYPIK